MEEEVIIKKDKKIYFLKDHEVNIYLLRQILKDRGYKILNLSKSTDLLEEINATKNTQNNNHVNNIKDNNDAVLIKENIPEEQRELFEQFFLAVRWVITILNKFNISFIFSYKGRYIICNKIFMEISGLDKEALKSVKMGDLINFQERKKVKDKIQKIAKDKCNDYSLEASFTASDTKVHQFKSLVLPHTIEGKNYVSGYGFYDSFHDIKDPQNITYLQFIVYELNNILSNLIKVNLINQYDPSEKKELVNQLEETVHNYSGIKLTRRENEVLQHICHGLTSQEIAAKLFISIRTVEKHRSNILQKTQTKNTIELIRFAWKNKLIRD